MKYDYIVEGAIHTVAGPLIKLKLSELLMKEGHHVWENSVLPIMKKYEFYSQISEERNILGYDFTACMFLLYPYEKDKGGNVNDFPGLADKFMYSYELSEKQLENIKFIRRMRNKGSHGNSYGAYEEELKKLNQAMDLPENEDDESGNKARSYLNKIREALKPLDPMVDLKIQTYFDQLDNALIKDSEVGENNRMVARLLEVPKSLPWKDAPNVTPLMGEVPWPIEARAKLIWPSEYLERKNEFLKSQPSDGGVKSFFKKLFG